MQPPGCGERIESSIVTSLSELRAIEQQRILDERAAIERARAAEIEAVRAAEQARIDAEEAKRRAERDEQLRIEQARLDAERELRLRVEAAAAAERAKHQAALDQQRLDEELALRRAEVAKKRPTWMLAVTALAIVATVGLGTFAFMRAREADEAAQQTAAANHDRELAKQQAQEAAEGLRQVQAELDGLSTKLVALADQLTKAQTDADRKRVADEIAATRKAAWDAQQRRDAIQKKIDHDNRVKPIVISPECQHNPLAHGCGVN